MDVYYEDDDFEWIVVCINKFCKVWYFVMKGLFWYDVYKWIYEEDG